MCEKFAKKKKRFQDRRRRHGRLVRSRALPSVIVFPDQHDSVQWMEFINLKLILRNISIHSVEY